jgi:quinol monooxygenase YgiN
MSGAPPSPASRERRPAARKSPTLCQNGPRIGAHGDLERVLLGPQVVVRLTVALSATSPRSAQDLLDALRFIVLGTRVEPGCLGSTAWTDPDFTVRYAENWATEDDIRRRVRSDNFMSLLSVVEAGKDPRVQFDFVTISRGLDYVAEVRREAQR